MERRLVKISKFLSLVLRHRPQRIGLELDPQGWADLDALITRARDAGVVLNRELVLEVVEKNDKGRFVLSEDGGRIRACQGHSIADLDLGLEAVTPPRRLYHGTARRFLGSIRAEGLRSRSRNHVHLSADEKTAVAVGRRHGRPVVLVVRAAEMQEGGHRFYLAENGVWLTDAVPPRFLEIPDLE
jgi:putative RNA 2'-phosphotransferase